MFVCLLMSSDCPLARQVVLGGVPIIARCERTSASWSSGGCFYGGQEYDAVDA